MKSNVFAVAIAAALLGGCATVVEGTSDQISVITPGADGAMCDLRSPDGQYTVKTPGVVTVSKSKHDINVRCEKDGFKEGVGVIPSNFAGMTLGNVLLGGVIGAGVDAASGAMNEYPNSFQVHMEKEEAPTPLPATPEPQPTAAPARPDATPTT